MLFNPKGNLTQHYVDNSLESRYKYFSIYLDKTRKLLEHYFGNTKLLTTQPFAASLLRLWPQKTVFTAVVTIRP